MSLNGQTPRPSRGLVVSGLPLLAQALSDVLQGHGFVVATVVGSGEEARNLLFGERPEIALLDLADATPSGLDLLRDARAAGLGTRIILFCNDGDGDTPIDAVELGVDGLLLRSATIDTVRLCLATVASGDQWLDPLAMKIAYERMARRQSATPNLLTRRERDVARLVAQGQRNRTIAAQLGISEGTVKMHLHNVYAKLGLESRTQLAMDQRMREIA